MPLAALADVATLACTERGAFLPDAAPSSLATATALAVGEAFFAVFFSGGEARVVGAAIGFAVFPRAATFVLEALSTLAFLPGEARLLVTVRVCSAIHSLQEST